MAAKVKSPALSTASANITSIFETDTLARHDFLKTYQRQSPLQPEKRLLLAVLKDAIEIFQKLANARNRRQRALFAAAEQWIYDKDADGLFTFNGACEALDLNPFFVRRGLTYWRKQRQSFSISPGATTGAEMLSSSRRQHRRFDRQHEHDGCDRNKLEFSRDQARHGQRDHESL